MSSTFNFPELLPDGKQMHVYSLGVSFPSYFHYYEYLRFNSNFVSINENLQKFLTMSYKDLVEFITVNKAYWRYDIPSFEDGYTLKKVFALFLEQNPALINKLIAYPHNIVVQTGMFEQYGNQRNWDSIVEQMNIEINRAIKNYRDWSIESEFYSS